MFEMIKILIQLLLLFSITRIACQFVTGNNTCKDGQPWPADQKCCPDGFECEYQSPYYSQCVSADTNSTDCSAAYAQCGGEGWAGPTCCVPGYQCTPDATNPQYYSGCTLIPVCENPFYGQCGGVDSNGKPWPYACCPEG
jgi:hypothetical protein